MRERLLQGFTAVALLVAFAGTGLSAWRYVGPYRWIAEASLRMFGSHEVQLTFLLRAR